MKLGICYQRSNYCEVDYSNGHEYVDLGLHSGRLWSTKNLGSVNKTDPGYYYSWKNTLDGLTYVENKDVLCEEQDIISKNMKGIWRLPTKRDILELFYDTLVVPDNLGISFIGSTGEILYIPKIKLKLDNIFALIWTSDLDERIPNQQAYLLSSVGISVANRNTKLPIRGVM